ncbi:hypothetical protein GGE65_007737 [Skermanella aerolata]|uniref:hypothetical protein n=1 Tax=Skermanella aerolata TaxID=393310 RepID=UPI003D23D720
MAQDRAALLAEAYRRDILPPNQKALYEEALRRGLLGEKEVSVAGEVGAFGSGVNRGIASAAGMPVDLVNAGLNLAGLGTEKPVGGSEWWKDRMGNVIDGAQVMTGNKPTGRAIIDAKAQTQAGRIAARVGEELGATALPMGAAMSLPRAASATGRAIQSSLAGVNNWDRGAQFGMAVGSGVGAGVAQEAAPGNQWAELAGSLAGGLGAGAGLYAGGQAVNIAAPLISQGAREQAAGNVIRRFNTPIEDMRARLIEQGYTPDDAQRMAQRIADQGLEAGLESADRSLVDGSKLTTAQSMQNPGLAQLERVLRSEDAQQGGRFAVRDAERAAAQRGAISAQAPEGRGAEGVADMVQGRFNQFRTDTADQVTGAQAATDLQLGLLGPGQDAVAAGGVIRKDLADARTAAKRGEKNLWSALDQNQDLALEMSAGREAALRMRKEIGPYAAAPTGDVAGILDAAAQLPGVVRFADLQQLRSRVQQAASDLKKAGNAVDLRRVQAVSDGLDQDIARAAFEQDGGIPAGAASAPRRAASGPQQGSTVYTPSGTGIDTEFELVDLAGPGAPVVSHMDDFRPNPSFPQELQPRDRGRAASEAQITEMAGKLNPERLGAGGVGDGAPIIGPDGVTESGNGRMLAIRRAYLNGGKQAAGYRDWLVQQGYDVEGMAQPALVRRRVNDLSPEQRLAYVKEANGGPGLRMSAVEQARADASMIGDDILSLYRGGALDDTSNVDFIRSVAGKLGSGESAALATKGGAMSVEGQRRLSAALLAKAFGSDSALVSSMLETGDVNIRSLGKALTDAAPGVAQLKARIAAGEVPAEFDPTAALLDAVKVVQQARKGGIPISDVLAQVDAFNPLHPQAETFLLAAYGDGFKRVSTGRTKAALDTYISDAMRQTGGGDMFGPGPTGADVWAAARRKAAGIVEPDVPPAGTVADGTTLPDATRSRVEQGAGSSATMPGGTGSDKIIGSGLSANFGADEAATYRAARAATSERKGTFDNSGSVGPVLRQGGFQARDGVYAMPVEQVAGRFFNSGAASHTDMQEFIRAAGDRTSAIKALQDFAVGDLRRVAVGADGWLDAARWGTWMKNHGNALRAFPELANRLNRVSRAQSMVDHLGDRRDAALKGFERSEAGKFLSQDPRAAVASVLGSNKKTEGLRQLVRMAKGDADRLGEIRRGVLDNMLSSIENNGGVDAAGELVLSQAKTTGFLKSNADALRASGVFSGDHLNALRAIEEDMRRATYVNTVGRAVGSPTYQNFSAGALLGQITLGLAGPDSPLAGTLLRPVSWLYRLPDDQVRRLLHDAMLDPAVAKRLVGRASQEKMNWVGETLRRRAVATGLISPASVSAMGSE